MIEQKLTHEFLEFLKEFLEKNTGTGTAYELQLRAVKEFQDLDGSQAV